jgi:alanine racemase
MKFSVCNSPKYIFDFSLLKKNIFFYKKKYQNSEISFVLKSDAYGVGCIEVSNFLIKNNFKSFFVGTVYEALNIKKNSNIANLDIYILYESICEDFYDLFLVNDFIFTINSVEEMLKLINISSNSNFKKKIKICIKINSGLNRLGISLKDLQKYKNYLQILYEKSEIKLIFSHLACGKVISEKNFFQLENFDKIIKYFDFKIKKSISSSNILKHSLEFEKDIIRVGSGMYGLVNDENLDLPLKIKAKIIKIFEIEKDEEVGYGFTFKAEKNMKIGVLAIGYADGLSYCIKKSYSFEYLGYKLFILGNVSMSLSVVDLSFIPENLLNKDIWVDVISKKKKLFEISEYSSSYLLEVFCRFGFSMKNKIFLNKI